MTDRPSSIIQIKGTRDGLLVTLDEHEDWEGLHSHLMQQLSQRAAFFQGARVVLDAGNRILTAEHIRQIQDDLSAIGITFTAVMSQSPVTEDAARSLGLATRIQTQQVEKTGSKNLDSYLEGESAIFLRKTLRSGFRVVSKGHVIVMGDVNPGAEIISSGSIIVWGKLRGVAIAGAEGDEKAVVCALDLSPTQLRIAEYIATSPKRKGKPQPEMAFIDGAQVVAEPWLAK